MRLGSWKSESRDGELVVVSKDNSKVASAADICGSVREALERWKDVEPQLQKRYEDLNSGNVAGEPFVNENMASVMPRTYQFADGSAYIQHIVLVRKARNAEPPETLKTVPLMYQAIGDVFLAPNDTIPQVDMAHGTDFEAEVGVIVDDVPMGVSASDALKHVKLVCLINDVSLRGLIPAELKQGFGFFQGKPNSSLSPVALTPDELGDSWKEGRLHLPMRVDYNGEKFGRADAGDMHFHFGDLVAHAARTRPLTAGTLIGSGTVANDDISKGSSCLAEKRMIEKIESGEFKTPFMSVGDTIKIEMHDAEGRNLFGTIEQKVAQA